MRMKIIGIFVIGILLLTGFVSIPTKAGPALQPLTSSDPQIIDMIQQVNESILYDYLAHLTAFGPRYTGSENSTKASQYIYDEFHAMGLSVEFHNWSFDKFTDRNVVATLQGSNISSNSIFIIDAHYDTVPISPGANDDGSGVAAILAAAKVLSQFTFNYTIRFIVFSGEEIGLYGSYSYARDASRRGDNIVGVINLDEIGYAHTIEGGQTLCVYRPERSKWLADFVTTVNTVYRKQTNLTIESYQNYISTDHQSFIDYGFDGVFGVQYDYDEYYTKYIQHSQNDTSEKINWTYLTKIARLFLAVVAELASTTLDLQVIITAPYQGYFYFFNQPLLPLDFWKNHWHGLRGTTFIVGRATLNVDVTPYHDVKNVLFCIDGNIITELWGVAPQPHYEWIIHNTYNHPLFGRHTIEVYAYTTSGKVTSDTINIIIF